MLIKKLNSCMGNLLPQTVKQDIHSRIKKHMDVLATRDALFSWVIGAMPQIAEAYHLEGQIPDSIQHYRFGFVQAEKLIKISGTRNFEEDPEKKMIALFTSVHDIGRMMVGSGASKDLYPKQGGLLHPIVGAMMLREAFEPMMNGLTKSIEDLLSALITTAERHTVSIGLLASRCKEQRISEIKASQYHGIKGHLLMVDTKMGEYGKYAHLIALADLINNVSVPGLSDVSQYDSQVGVEGMTPEQRVDYLIHGPGNGKFRVKKTGEQKYTYVERTWRRRPSKDDCPSWLTQMEEDVTKFPTEESEIRLAKAAFIAGSRIALA